MYFKIEKTKKSVCETLTEKAKKNPCLSTYASGGQVAAGTKGQFTLEVSGAD